jgi:hypothetical protein
MNPSVEAMLQRLDELVYKPRFTLATKQAARDMLQLLRDLYVADRQVFTAEVITAVNQYKTVLANRILQTNDEMDGLRKQSTDVAADRSGEMVDDRSEDFGACEVRLEPWLDAEWWKKFGAEIQFYEGPGIKFVDNDDENDWDEYYDGIAEGLDPDDIDWESLDGD